MPKETATPSGSSKPSMTYSKDRARGDGKGKARVFGQDLMKKEHIVGGNPMSKTALKNGFTTEKYGLHGDISSDGTGTSIFDPVLCELAYQWFCPAGGCIVDPFAGGSVRGIVAAFLGFQYIGIDLSMEQIEANRDQANDILKDNPHPVWHIGNSLNIDSICKGVEADFIFSCPPYHNLEVYSDNPEDLSTLPYDEFIKRYNEIISKSLGLLKADRFACFVVADIRDKKGFYKNFVSDTIKAFQQAGAALYNEIILVNVAGSLPIRAGRQFNSGRKVGKMHQNVLVFYKGNPKNIKDNFPEIDFSSLIEEIEGTEQL